MQQDNTYPQFKRFICLFAMAILFLIGSPTYAQDTRKSILDINNSKIIKKANQFLDTTQKKINNFINKRIERVRDSLNKKTNRLLDKTGINEMNKLLPYERLLDKKYTLGRRAYQNTVSQFNYLFNADISLDEIIQKARDVHEDDYTELLPFYDYDLSITAKESIDSIIYRCNANIVLHDLRNNYTDDTYLLLAKSYLFHKDFDTAEKNLKMSAAVGSKIAENEGSTKVQLGMVALQKSNFKDSEKYFREALKISLDSDNKAMALLGMVQIYMNKRDIRAGKDFLMRAKNCKSKNEQVVAQIKDLDKHLARVPG